MVFSDMLGMYWMALAGSIFSAWCTGADVWWNGAFHRVADPLRHPLDGVRSLTNPIGSALDKVNVGLFRTLTLFSPLASIYAASETTTLSCLRVSMALQR